MTMLNRAPVGTAYNLKEPNAEYAPKGTPIRMALHRDPDVPVDVVGIVGYAREVPKKSPDGQWLFTVDGYVASDMDHSYWVYKHNLKFL